MGIDWITVSAQIVNFLVLVWLLKRFLYQPVMRAMDRREQRIAEQLNEALAREQKADEAEKQYQEKSKTLEHTCNDILARAQEKAELRKKELLDEARREVAEIREHWQRQVQQEKEEFLNDLRYQVSNATQSIARKALKELADTELEKQIIHAFINRLASLDKASHRLMLNAAKNSAEPARVTSTFDLDSVMRTRITRAVHEHLIAGIDIEYNESPDLLCGIALTIGEGQLGWNLADYLQQLSQRVEEAFAPTAPTAPVQSDPLDEKIKE